MTANVPRELRDRFKATLPEGTSINQALRGLIEGALVGKADQLGVLKASLPNVSITNNCGGLRAVHSTSGDGPGVGPESANPPESAPATHSQTPDPGCVHPHGVLYRQGHSVICGSCGKVVR